MSLISSLVLWKRYGSSVLRGSTILLGLTVPISVALDNLLLGILLLGFLFNVRVVWQVVRQNHVARAAWLLFFVLLTAMFYGGAPLREAAGALGKYADLWFVPLFMLMLPNDVLRRRVIYAFLTAMGITLLLSYLFGLGLLPKQHWMSSATMAANPFVFHGYITQNNMMAFAVFLALLQLREAGSRGIQMGWGLFAVLAAANVLFMVQGRTGYLILLVLLGWFAWTTLTRYMRSRGRAWSWRQGVLIILVLGGLVAVTFFNSPRVHDRVSTVGAELQAWQPNQEDQSSSTGTRLNFYYNAIQIIWQHPIAGVGMGGVERAFTAQIQGTNLTTTKNPHNEYLLIAAQSGVGGLALLLYLFYTLWRCAPLLESALEQDAARGLVLAYMVNSTFNSALHDHSDGLFFALMTAVLFAGLKTGKRG